LTTNFKTTWVIVSVVTSANVSSDQITKDRDQANRFMGADVAEMLFFKSALSSSTRQAVETYLGNKYNISLAQMAPVASNVLVNGTLDVGNTATGTYVYTDANSDLEGTSTFKWYRSNDALGTGKTAIGGATSTSYALVAADDAKYLSFEVTPVALTGTSPGTAAESPLRGPVNQVHSAWSQASVGSLQGGLVIGGTAVIMGTGSTRQLVSRKLSNGTTNWSYSTPNGDCGNPTLSWDSPVSKIVAATGNYVVGVQDNGGTYTELFTPQNLSATLGTPYISPEDTSFYVVCSNTLTRRSLRTGLPMWTATFTNGNTSADIVVYSDNIYAATTVGTVDKGDAVDFTPLSTYALSGSPAITLPLMVMNDTLYVTPNTSELYAINAVNMTTLVWKATLGAVNSAPAINEYTSANIYVAAGTTIQKVVAGSVVWTYDAGATITAGPVPTNGVVYFGTSGKYYAVRDNGGTGSLISQWPYVSVTGNTIGPCIDISNNRVIFGSAGGNLDAFPLQ
jgi:hypothetical protein